METADDTLNRINGERLWNSEIRETEDKRTTATTTTTTEKEEQLKTSSLEGGHSSSATLSKGILNVGVNIKFGAKDEEQSNGPNEFQGELGQGEGDLKGIRDI